MTPGLDSRHDVSTIEIPKEDTLDRRCDFGSLGTANHECDTDDRWNLGARVPNPFWMAHAQVNISLQQCIGQQ